MSARPKALCVVAGYVEGLSIPAVLRDTDFDWRCVVASGDTVDVDVSSLVDVLYLDDEANPFQPVGWFGDKTIDGSQRLLGLIDRLQVHYCWVIGAVGLALVPLQARSARLNHPVRKYMLTASGDFLGPDDFPERAFESYAQREVHRMADLAASGSAQIVPILNRWANDSPIQKREDAEPKTPLVSVCIPHYNYGQFLQEQIDSLKAQTYAQFEVITIDDGSTDPEALRVWDELVRANSDPRFKFIRRAENKGLSITRNEAAERAGGEWLVFCDADNRSHPEMLEHFVRAADQSRADVVVCYAHQFETVKGRDQTLEYFTPVGGALELGWAYNVFGDANALVRRKVFDQSGGFTSQPGLTAEDWELWVRIAWQGGEFAVIPKALFDYRVHGASVMRTSSWTASMARVHEVYLQQAESLPMLVQSRFWKDMISAFPHFLNWRIKAADWWDERSAILSEKAEVETYTEELKAVIDRLNAEKAAADRFIDELKDSLAALNAEKATADGFIEELRGSIDGLTAAKAEADGFVSQLKGALSGLKGEKAKSDKYIEALKTTLSQVQADKASADAFIEELKEGLLFYQKENSLLRDENERLQLELESERSARELVERQLAWQQLPFWKRWRVRRPENVQ